MDKYYNKCKFEVIILQKRIKYLIIIGDNLYPSVSERMTCILFCLFLEIFL
ncbi:hypothetical protein Lalb_Chr13g0290851 [Lupinus albus]|uniref:Uncharacterized protein n=1 Tax=Lupinus albus TaxID=3870 RepID=A0A6A4PHD2_LUPAL|nr:hypothetical protein Lalb_Chr13g0290851 [Lupinus albus]